MLLNLLAINTDDLVKALNIFWKGMLAIAIVICIIIVVTMIMNKISDVAVQKKSKDQSPDGNDQNG